MAVQDGTRIDLVFPKSGQVLHVCVPDSHVERISRRNFEILLSLQGKAALASYTEHLRLVHGQPS
jgi:hypothetical protein